QRSRQRLLLLVVYELDLVDNRLALGWHVVTVFIKLDYLAAAFGPDGGYNPPEALSRNADALEAKINAKARLRPPRPLALDEISIGLIIIDAVGAGYSQRLGARLQVKCLVVARVFVPGFSVSLEFLQFVKT